MRKTLSRRTFLGTTAGISLAAATSEIGAPVDDHALAAQAPRGTPSTAAPTQDIVLVNGRIHAMDARNTMTKRLNERGARTKLEGRT